MKVGIVYDMQSDYGMNNSDLTFCDFVHLSDIEYIKESLEMAGCLVELIGAPKSLAKAIQNKSLDVNIIFNLAEGIFSRNRESIVPALCEVYDIPYIGGDAFCLSFTLHKHQTLLFAQSIGLNIPNGFIFNAHIHNFNNIEKMCEKYNFPMVTKPNREGTSMGIGLAHNPDQLQENIKAIMEQYNQEVLCDEYIPGHEIAVPIIGTREKALALGIVEYQQTDGSIMPFYTSELKEHGNHKTVYRSFGREIDKKIISDALFLHRAIDCYDISRIDMKLNNGIPYILEVTPSPGMNKGGTFEEGGRRNGLTYPQLLNVLISSAQERYS